VTAQARQTRAKASPPPLPTRQAILDAAERMFSARGVDGVAVRDLARELKLTPSSLYNHFPSKQALYDAVLERGLRPIVAMVADAWQPGGLRADSVRGTVDQMTAHLVMHPHLGRLLQRALIEEGGSGQELLARWLGPLYEQGVNVTRQTAVDAGWEPQEIPHLTLGLFGLMFSYFTNGPAVRRVAGWEEDFSARALTVQRRFLEKAVFRLLGPQPTPKPADDAAPVAARRSRKTQRNKNG
jgi:AcrR family transcriptional regulator